MFCKVVQLCPKGNSSLCHAPPRRKAPCKLRPETCSKVCTKVMTADLQAGTALQEQCVAFAQSGWQSLPVACCQPRSRRAVAVKGHMLALAGGKLRESMTHEGTQEGDVTRQHAHGRHRKHVTQSTSRGLHAHTPQNAHSTVLVHSAAGNDGDPRQSLT